MLKHLIMILFICVIAVGIAGCGGANSNSSDTNTPSATATPSASTTVSPTASLTPTSLHVSGLSIVTNPSVLSKVSCNSTTNIAFTATIMVDAGSSGGSVAYTWAANGSSTPGHVTFDPGQTSKTVTYTLNNVLVQYNSANTNVTLTVNSPNTIASAPSKPIGNCTFPGPFTVVGLGLGVSPAYVTGLLCGTTINVTYTATITIAPNSNGGTVALIWNFPHLSRAASVVFAPGTTTQSISYTLTGKLARNIFPRPVSISSISPTALTSNYAVPAGTCA